MSFDGHCCFTNMVSDIFVMINWMSVLMFFCMPFEGTSALLILIPRSWDEIIIIIALIY